MKMYRKRFIPNEIIDISGDEVIKKKDGLIVTKWLPIHPRGDIGSGMSYVYYKEGYKISKFYDQSGSFLFYYCDIIDYKYNAETDEWTFIDLLVDVKYYNDGKIEILDFDELNDAFNQELISSAELLKACTNLNKLLGLIINNKFDKLVK